MSKKKISWMLLSGASLAAMGALSPAMAQEDDMAEDEIVVTATGRSAAIQDVPLAVTAIGGDQLENSGVQDLRDVTQVAPSLQMGTGQSNSSGTIARIRGIGTGSDNPGFEAAVGIFIDGVYRARAGAALADLPELERVEVLRGPQGTLFGRNTSAGAISVISAGPDLAPGMYLEGLLGVDDLDEGGLRAGVNVAMSDSFAFRLDGSVRERDGYITDAISGDDINTRNRSSVRGQALWDISPDASLRVIVDASESDEVCCGVTKLVFGTTDAVISGLTGGGGLVPAGGVLPINLSTPRMTVTPGRGYGEQTDDGGISAELDWDIGGVNLTSITSYRDWSAERDQDVDFTSADIAYRDGLEVGFKNFTQEIRLQGEAGNINWLVGLFYGDEQMDSTDRIRVGAQQALYSYSAVRGANPNGPELFNFNPGAASFSIFQGAANNPVGAIQPFLSPAQLLALNTAIIPINAQNAGNGGYLLPTTGGQGQQSDAWHVDTQSLAIFTHNEISLGENLVLTLGARYNQETKDLTAELLATNNSCTGLRQLETATTGLLTASAVPGFPGGIVSFLELFAPDAMNLACNPAVNTISNGNWAGDSEENEFSGTASLAYHMNDDVMVYGGYSRGYKAGGFNVDRSGFSVRPSTTSAAALNTGQLAFLPEFTDAYELGLKSTIFGGSTTANVALFYQQIHDYQSNNFNGFNFITRNVPETISQGAELEISARPMDGLTINGGVVYTEAFYDSTVVFNAQNPIPNTITAGDPLSFAPELVVTGAVSYEMSLGGDMRALFYVDGRWNSEYRTQTLNRDPLGRTDNDAFAVYNGRIGIGPENERWSIELWGQNLLEEEYFIGSFSPPLQNSFVIYPNEPRTYGVTLRARY